MAILSSHIGKLVIIITDCRVSVARYSVSATPNPSGNGNGSLLSRDYSGVVLFSARHVNVCGTVTGVCDPSHQKRY